MKMPSRQTPPPALAPLRRRDAIATTLTLLLSSRALPAFSTAADIADFNGFDVANAAVPTSAIQRGGPPKDGIPAIDRPKFVRGAQAQLANGDRVLGVVLSGQARAYPVRILNWHEVVNDRFGERQPSGLPGWPSVPTPKYCMRLRRSLRPS